MRLSDAPALPMHLSSYSPAGTRPYCAIDSDAAHELPADLLYIVQGLGRSGMPSSATAIVTNSSLLQL